MDGKDLEIAFGGMTAHQAGKLLRRAADSGVAVAGYRVRAADRTGGNSRRRIVEASSLTPGADAAKFTLK